MTSPKIIRKAKFYFTPKSGKYNLENPERFKNLPLFLTEKRHVMTIKEDKLTRSEKQNRYMWGVVYEYISQETGYVPEEVHQLMAKKFLTYFKKMETFVKSTTKLSTKEMEEYLENIRRFASMELSLYIPLPNESDEFAY